MSRASRRSTGARERGKPARNTWDARPRGAAGGVEARRRVPGVRWPEEEKRGEEEGVLTVVVWGASELGWRGSQQGME